MTEMFKRSLKGYDLEGVQQEIDRTNQAYEMKIKDLKKEITESTQQREMLRIEYGKIKQELDFREDLQQRIKDRLFEKHLELSNQYLVEKKKMEATIADLNNQVRLKQEELAKYKRYAYKVKTDILKMRDHFETIMDEEEGVEDR